MYMICCNEKVISFCICIQKKKKKNIGMDSIPFIVSIHYFVHISQLIICFKRRYLCTNLQRKTTYDINYKKNSLLTKFSLLLLRKKNTFLQHIFPFGDPSNLYLQNIVYFLIVKSFKCLVIYVFVDCLNRPLN